MQYLRFCLLISLVVYKCNKIWKHFYQHNILYTIYSIYINLLYTISLEAIGGEAMTKIGYVLNWLSSRYHMLTQLTLIQVHTLHTHTVYAYFAKLS